MGETDSLCMISFIFEPRLSQEQVNRQMSTQKALVWLIALMPLLVAGRNCTYPFSLDETIKWQRSACYRGTWSIISSCLTTIIACTWSIQHLNVPCRRETTWTKTWRKIKWMVITVIFPEWILIHALIQFYMALRALEMMDAKGRAVKWPWWRRFPSVSLRKDRYEDEEKKKERNIDDEWTLVHCYFANMGGLVIVQPKKDGEEDVSESCCPVTAKQLAESPYTRPPLLVKQIMDKSKQDWLAKTIAAVQILQLVLSIITRRIQHAAFSQLEILTLSFAVCGILIYFSNFYKPQNVDWALDINEFLFKSHREHLAAGSQPGESVTHSIVAGAELRGSESETRVGPGPLLLFEKHWDSLVSIMLNKPSKYGVGSTATAPSRIPNDNIPIYEGQNDIHPAIYLLALASGLFGAMHAIAWNFEFPTPVEKLLWQVATLVSAVSPIVGLLTVPLSQYIKSAGQAKVFMSKCVQLLREFTWDNIRDRPIDEARQKLEARLAAAILGNEIKSLSYSDIFAVGEGAGSFIRELEHFLQRRPRYDTDHEIEFPLRRDTEFRHDFSLLVAVLSGKSTKKLQSVAMTDLWPMKPVLPRSVNLGILYTTGFLYCASRLVLIGVSFSSIREMPSSVYKETDWTGYLPRFGASGG